MARAPRFLQVLPVIVLSCAALRADWLLDEAHKKLLARSPSVKALRDKSALKEARPRQRRPPAQPDQAGLP